MNKYTPWVIIIVLVAIIIWLAKCKECDTIPGRIDTVTDTSYIHDTTFIKGKTKIKPIAVPYYIHDTIIDSTGDTVVIQLKKYVTNDTFIYDADSVKVTVYTKIYSNGPLDSISNELKTIIRQKIVENTITKEVIRKDAFFAGPAVGLGRTNYIALDGLYERNGKIIYKLGIGINANLQPMLRAGIYWQISK